MADKLVSIVESIEGLTVMELADLVSALEEKFGVSAQAPMVVAAGAVAAGPGAAAEEEQTEFDAILTEIGENKIQVIKVVRALTSLGLKEAKDLVDNSPKPIKESVPKEEAETVKKQIEEVGGTVEIK
ncbi:MAG: 50S ribosomal protein L7/L12 [Candidatus Latescibacteria bacterium]|jgi:large subunit ribosomal protein L7/L12|nr:50S ribosomal protein L7/L12 [Candidatus Latescibacterota bacterium]